ncbi:MAG: iron-sulfur cluster assembly accessory protein [Bacteroidota bacterium]
MSEHTGMTKTEATEVLAITPKAVGEIKRIRAENHVPEAFGLRVGVKGGGCSGMSYVLGFDEKPKEEDETFELQGVTVFIDKKSLMYLSGTQLDFTDGLNGSGFVFNNPNAKKTCGCGSSFGV